jgi:hypothetical protein
MASDHDRSVSPQSDSPNPWQEPLPPRPNLEMQQKRAKDLLRAVWARDPEALARLRALHPKPPEADALKLADAQLVVARGYGFESWAALKRRIEALTLTPRDQFRRAIDAGDVEAARTLLAEHAEARAAVNEPFGAFGSRPVSMASRNLPLVDVLLAHGADINLKSAWPPGGFGVLEGCRTPDEAAPLIARGAIVDVFAAAQLGMVDRLRELLDADPSLVHARGGDGKTPLHYAPTLEIARDLIARGANIDARCVDHFSTPAQYHVRERPEIARDLVERGAWFDIFIAVALRDHALIERCLRDDPQALDHRTWHGKYDLPRGEHGVPVRNVPADCRGDIYRWVFDHNVTALDVAATLGFDDVVERLAQAATPVQRLLAACWRADRVAAEAVTAQHPDVIRTLTPAQMSLIAYKAHASDTAAVALMIDLGFDPRARGTDQAEPLRWAAFLGNAEMVRLLLAHDPPIGIPDPQFQGTPLGWCIYGAVHGWACQRGDFPTCARLLIAAGEKPDPSMLPTGRDDVDVVLREYFARV